jgi:hypothetical protein
MSTFVTKYWPHAVLANYLSGEHPIKVTCTDTSSRRATFEYTFEVSDDLDYEQLLLRDFNTFESISISNAREFFASIGVIGYCQRECRNNNGLWLYDA